MRPLILLLAGLLLGGGAVLWYLRSKPDASGAHVHRSFARAKAYYLNETNADYRRARLELEPWAERLQDSVAYHIDLALIDLQELNYEVQDQYRLDDVPFYERLLRSALAHLGRARNIEPDNDSVAYNLARTYIKLAPLVEEEDTFLGYAEELLGPLSEKDPPDPSALLIYGDLQWDKNDVEAASALYSRIIDLGEDFVPRTLFYVALSKKTAALRRLGRSEEAQEYQDRIEAKYGDDRPKATPGALERGRYTEFLELAAWPRPEEEARTPDWFDITRRTGLPALGTPRFLINPDLDGDCARDIVMNSDAGLRVLRNRRDASFADLTPESGLPADFVLAAAAAGDLDGDGLADLVLGGPSGLRVFLNSTDPDKPTSWRFREITASLKERAREPAACVVLWDLDHDGDLDVFAGGARNRVYRTAVEMPEDGGRLLVFKEVAADFRLDAPAAAEALILDVEGDHDVDLLLTGPDGNAWFENLRELRYSRRDLPAGAGLAAADVDNDEIEEVWIGGTVHEWTGEGWRRLFERPALLDLDADGFIDADPFAGLPAAQVERVFGADLNRDGNPELMRITAEGLSVHLARPQRPRAWIDLRPRGLKTNEFGIGTRLRLFAGDLRIGATCRDGIVSFGLGRRPVVDAVVVRWTNGVEQGVVTPLLASCRTVEEREGEVGSCPFLYAFDGKRWHFVADCQSGTPLGLPYADGKYLPARSNETIFVPGAQLKPVAGMVRLDLAEEFRELFYADQVVLRAIDHPEDARPVLNEGFRIMKFPEFRVHSLDDLRPPRAARDHKGTDILPLVSARDGRHAVVWDRIDSRYVGLAREWAIELDFGDLTGAERILFVMDGWVEFPTASASIASAQAATVAFKPPVLEVMGADGKWVVADKDPGFPAGKGKAVLVDLTGKIPTRDGRIRISSTQRLHWDAFSISTGPDRPLRLTALPLRRADHRWRGVGRRVEDPAGEQPWRYSHDELVTFHSWDQMPMGMLTAYGDVRQLLADIDDRYPVLASGDVIELEFDATGLPPLPEGWVRDWCFTTEGWVKDADMNQAVRESVTPLPFHAMSGYPYDEAEESHPHPDFVAKWFTRPARKLVDPKALLPKPGAESGVR